MKNKQITPSEKGYLVNKLKLSNENNVDVLAKVDTIKEDKEKLAIINLEQNLKYIPQKLSTRTQEIYKSKTNDVGELRKINKNLKIRNAFK